MIPKNFWTREAFITWAFTHSPRTRAGIPEDCSQCLLARYLRAYGAKNINISGKVAEYENANGHLRAKHLPTWAQNFIEEYDKLLRGTSRPEFRHVFPLFRQLGWTTHDEEVRVGVYL